MQGVADLVKSVSIKTISTQSALSWRLSLFIAGAIYPLAFAPFEIWPLAFVSIAYLLLALSEQRDLSAFKIGYYWGLGAFGVGVSWVFVSIHEFGFVPWPGAAALTLLFVAFLALYKAFFGYFCARILQMTQPSLLVLIAPTLWVVFEYLQSVIFNGFPWLLAGYSQIDSPVSSVAPMLSVYGVSWFVLAISAALVILLKSRKSTATWSVLAVLFVFVASAPGFSRQIKPSSQAAKSDEERVLSVSLVQPNIAQSQKWDRRYFSKIINVLMTETERLWHSDLIVWPEGAIPAYAHQVEDILSDLTAKAVATDSNLILGIPEFDPASKKSFVALKGLGKQPQSYHKQVLVPFGEYVPMEDWLRGVIKFLDLPMSAFSIPSEPQQPMWFEQFSVIPAICYEIVYPQLIRQLSRAASAADLPQVLVTVSNDAWFGDSFGPYQHMQMARMRALELGVPLVRSTNDGITAVVDARGTMLKALPRYQQGSLRFDLPLQNIRTPFKSWGSYPLLVLLALSGVIVFAAVWRIRTLKP